MRVPILYQDDRIVVIDKPVGIPARVAGDVYPGDALAITRTQLGLDYLGVFRHLEAEASGVVLYAGSKDASASLAALDGRAVEITYLALVHGSLPHPTGTIDDRIARDRDANVERYKVTTAKDKRGQRAVTHYRVLETDPTGRYSLLEVVPQEAEQSHQVRVHLAHLGVPVVGDSLYGTEEADGKAKPQNTGAQAPHGGRSARALPAAGRGQQTLRSGSAKHAVQKDLRPAGVSTRTPQFAPRLCLHASRLTLPHPATGQPITFSAPPPVLFTRLATGLPDLALAAAGRHIRRIKAGSPGLRELIDLALTRRAPLAGDPQTTIYRLINAAADGLPGLVVDRYGEALVVSIYDDSGRPEPLVPALVDALMERSAAEAVYVKYRQREASRVDEEALPALAPPRPMAGRNLGEYPAYEAGLAYLLRPGEGWNPGLFADMREMRARVRYWAPGKRVLNCFAYTCGFGLTAMAGGAERVVNLDVSKPLLERGWANYLANGFPVHDRDFLYGDVFDWLPRLARQKELFDIVILDPPGFARTKTHTFSAAQNYGQLAQIAAQVIAPDGLLVACCNVADLSWSSFRNKIVAGLDDAWRAAEILGTYGAPTLDFPSLPNHDSYLKILVARLK